MKKEEFIIEAVLRMITGNASVSVDETVKTANELAEILYPQKQIKYDDPVSVLADELERIDERNKEEKCNDARRRDINWNHGKSGFCASFQSVCRMHDIEDIDTLLSLGRAYFRKFRGVGIILLEAIDKALFNLYGIQRW